MQPRERDVPDAGAGEPLALERLELELGQLAPALGISVGGFAERGDV